MEYTYIHAQSAKRRYLILKGVDDAITPRRYGFFLSTK